MQDGKQRALCTVVAHVRFARHRGWVRVARDWAELDFIVEPFLLARELLIALKHVRHARGVLVSLVRALQELPSRRALHGEADRLAEEARRDCEVELQIVPKLGERSGVRE